MFWNIMYQQVEIDGTTLNLYAKLSARVKTQRIHSGCKALITYPFSVIRRRGLLIVTSRQLHELDTEIKI